MATQGARYTVPKTINPQRMDEKHVVRFRVGDVYKNCYVSVYLNDERIIHRKRPVVAPGEMEQVELKKEQLEKFSIILNILIQLVFKRVNL